MFNKQIVVSITKAEFLQLLADKGLSVPTNTPIHNAWKDKIDFPIVIRWEENGTLNGPRVPRDPRVALFHEEAIVDLLKKNRVIDAIKYTRTITGWGLKEAKDYVDHLRDKGSL